MDQKSAPDLEDFIREASIDTRLLQSFLRDPERMATRFNIDQSSLDNLKTAQGLLSAVATLLPQRLSLIAAGIYAKQSPMAFGDFRDSPGYRDSFRDGASDGNFVDRYNDGA
jgi:hypothetical protein